jgi:uncharacterized membrane protein YkoI
MPNAARLVRRVLMAALFITAATTSYALEGGDLSKEATITLDQARATAVKAQPGKILDQELEHRNGGSGLRYSFDIKVGAVTHEVGIDAKTGAVLQNSAEGRK